MIASVFRKAHFNAAHRLHNPDWDEAKNQKVFGLCNNPNYHGHNYELIVGVSGKVDPDTGFVIDIKFLSDLIKSEIENRFDHKNLNLDTVEFKHLNPTAEHIAYVCFQLLRPHIPTHLRMEITLYETPRNFVKYAE
jgi:6-pyruvoyltetrahydropterin/6-carboxytetrahydropterin synthase